MADATDFPAVSFVQPSETTGPTNLLLYGPAGAGKTTGAFSAPGPVIALNAEGPSAFRFARSVYGNSHIREVTFEGRATLDAFTSYLKNERTDEKTVVVDSLGEIHTQIIREIGGRSPQIQHYGTVNTLISDLVRFLRDLPLNVVLVAHEQIEDNEEGGATRRPQTGGTKLPETVMAMMDVVAYCSVKPGQKENDPPVYVGQFVQARGRRAKDRSGALGAWRPLDLSDWLMTIDKALTPGDLPWEQPSLEEAE